MQTVPLGVLKGDMVVVDLEFMLPTVDVDVREGVREGELSTVDVDVKGEVDVNVDFDVDVREGELPAVEGGSFDLFLTVDVELIGSSIMFAVVP
jgi:hypothetical protein